MLKFYRKVDDMLSSKEIGKRVKEAREHYGKKIGFKFTQSDLAQKIGVTRGYICEIEAGRANPSTPRLQAIAEACEVTMGWFSEDKQVELPQELREIGIEYITVARELKDDGLSPEEIKKIAEIVKMMKK
jgi:transcriptional regulator with XRE-family HTH domain